MVNERLTEESMWNLIGTVKDPEIPVVSIIELGIVRSVALSEGHVTVTVTPTYSGCPAMHIIEEEIRSILMENGAHSVEIRTVYSPAWTTDWIEAQAKIKLREYGIAPPHAVAHSPVLQIELPAVRCPLCNSDDTTLKSEFGSTACKSYYICHQCSQPFEYFKPL